MLFLMLMTLKYLKKTNVKMGKKIYLTEEQVKDFIRFSLMKENVYVNDIDIIISSFD